MEWLINLPSHYGYLQPSKTKQAISLKASKERVSRNEQCENGAIISLANIDKDQFGSMFKNFVDVRNLYKNIIHIWLDSLCLPDFSFSEFRNTLKFLCPSESVLSKWPPNWRCKKTVHFSPLSTGHFNPKFWKWSDFTLILCAVFIFFFTLLKKDFLELQICRFDLKDLYIDLGYAV